MKTIFRKVLKIFMLITYPILLIALIVLSVVYFVRNRDYNNLNNAYQDATISLNQENQTKQVTIDDLRKTYEDLNQQITSLKTENTNLKAGIEKVQQTGYGNIAGKIFPFVTAGTSDFQQYQRVCAESVANSNVQICQTVSAIDQTFAIGVPAGNYYLYAEVFPTPSADSALYKYKAYYTEYVACVKSKAAAACDGAILVKPVNIEVKAGETVSNADPIDWKKAN